MSKWPSWADIVALTVSVDVKQDLKKYPIFPKDFLQTVPTRSAGEMLPPQLPRRTTASLAHIVWPATALFLPQKSELAFFFHLALPHVCQSQTDVGPEFVRFPVVSLGYT